MLPENPFRRILPIVTLPMGLMAIGLIGYRILSDLPWLDALYMTVTTLTTVGYREVGEMDTDSKVFTIS